MTDNHRNHRAHESTAPGIDSPPMPSPAGASMLALMDQLSESEWWSPAEIRRHQMRQLLSLVRHAVSHVPFYGDGDGKPVAGGPSDAMDMEQWSQLPVLTRREVQAHCQAMHSREIPVGHGNVSETGTSGSTGQPVTIRTTQRAQTFSAVFGLRAHRWHGRDLGGRLAAIHMDRGDRALYPEGLHQPGWGWPAGDIYRTGPAALLNLRTPIPDQAEWLQRRNPDYLLSCPSNLLVLAEHCIEHGIRLPALRDVATIMEVVTPELREACRRAWDVPVVDMYTTREAGCIAVQCPENEHYHVMAEGVFVEILDEQDRPCEPGEIGRVVVTPLHNFAMPLLRYDIGDFAEVGEACSCGRGLPVLKRVLGRVRNMLVLPDGQRAWPSFGRRKLVSAAPITQHQVVQKDLHTLEVRLVTARPLTRREEAAIRHSVAERLPVSFDIVLRYVERIERGPGGKFEDFQSEIA